MIDVDYLARTACLGANYHVDRQWLVEYTCRVLERAADTAHDAVLRNYGGEYEVADAVFNAIMHLRP